MLYQKLLLLVLILSITFLSSCSDDDNNDTNSDPCSLISCPSGQICSAGTCISSQKDETGFPGVAASQRILSWSTGWDGAAKMTPHALVYQDTFHMWYTGFESYPSLDARIGYAWSLDGSVWNRSDGPINISLEDSGPGLGRPIVIRDNDQFRMWYVSNFPCSSGCRYKSAVSDNGFDWEVEVTPQSLSVPGWAQPMLVPGSVIKESGGYKMWFTGNENPPNAGDTNTPRIGHATSDDGFTWTPRADPVLTNGSVGSYDHSIASWPSVYKHDGIYHMYYRGDQNPGASPGDSYTLYAQSSDGINWEKSEEPALYSTNWAFNDLHAPSAIIYDETIWLFYSAYLDSGVGFGVTTKPLE